MNDGLYRVLIAVVLLLLAILTILGVLEPSLKSIQALLYIVAGWVMLTYD